MKTNLKTNIKEIHIDWSGIYEACLETVGKQSNGKEPSSTWKQKLLLAEHSPIRLGTVRWEWEEIPYCISTHFVRHHVGCTPFVQTSRGDRTGKSRDERSQTDPVRMMMEANIQSIIDISRKRLCNCADPTTIKYWYAFLKELAKYEPEVVAMCVPECIRRCGCPEFQPCSHFENTTKNWTKEELIDLKTRYEKYNKSREKVLALTKK